MNDDEIESQPMMANEKEDDESDQASSTPSSYENITYNAALVKTVYLKPKSPPLGSCKRIWIKCCGGCVFQIILIALFIILAQLVSPLINGLGFLEKEPKRFECRDAESGEWKPCSKQEICAKGLSKDDYRPDKNDDEYFDNWVDKYDLLCESKFKVGLLGSVGFIGVISTLLILPPLGDRYGRKLIFTISNVMTIIGQLGLILSNNIYEAYFFAFLIGATFSGKVVVGLNYMLEFNRPKWTETIIYLQLVGESVSTIMFTFWYQFIDRGWFLLQLICLILAVLITIYFLIVVPESPKWLYTFFRFDESKENLKYVASFNGLPESKQERIKRVKFDLELLEKQKEFLENRASDGRSIMDVQSQITARRETISDNQYIINVVIMTIFWTVASFSFYLLLFMNKYYEGSIYVNFYLDGLSGIVGSSISLFTYGFLRMRWSFGISLSITLIFVILILIYQQGYASPHWVGSMVPEGSKSPHEEDSEDDRQYYLAYLIPALVFMAKVGVNMTFQNTYQASFGENLIFPFYKRATAIGICNFIARTVTITSSLAAELDRPWPAVLLIAVQSIAFIAIFFLPYRDEEIEYEQKIAEEEHHKKMSIMDKDE